MPLQVHTSESIAATTEKTVSAEEIIHKCATWLRIEMHLMLMSANHICFH